MGGFLEELKGRIQERSEGKIEDLERIFKAID